LVWRPEQIKTDSTVVKQFALLPLPSSGLCLSRNLKRTIFSVKKKYEQRYITAIRLKRACLDYKDYKSIRQIYQRKHYFSN
jgi:hypothetical protein